MAMSRQVPCLRVLWVKVGSEAFYDGFLVQGNHLVKRLWITVWLSKDAHCNAGSAPV